LSELPHLFFKLHKGPTYIKGFFRRNALKVRSFSYDNHSSNLEGEKSEKMKTGDARACWRHGEENSENWGEGDGRARWHRVLLPNFWNETGCAARLHSHAT